MDFQKSNYLVYFTQLVSAFQQMPTRAQGMQLLYQTPKTYLALRPIASIDLIWKQLVYYPIQASSNCYAKSHEPGFCSRLQQDAQLIQYLLTQEQQYALS